MKKGSKVAAETSVICAELEGGAIRTDPGSEQRGKRERERGEYTRVGWAQCGLQKQ